MALGSYDLSNICMGLNGCVLLLIAAVSLARKLFAVLIACNNFNNLSCLTLKFGAIVIDANVCVGIGVMLIGDMNGFRQWVG